jgi:hypothetical protein
MMVRLGFIFALTFVAAAGAGCSIGAPERASDIQNPYAIPDDISSVRMTLSDTQKVADPNLPTTLPHNYQLPQD